MTNTYLIHESNIDRLERQLKTIQNKCNKAGVQFSYKRIREVFKDVRDDETLRLHTAKFIEVEASGMVKINGWTFVAVIEHMDGNGRNIVRQFNLDHEVPERYYTIRPRCEHCNTNRTRKQTYLLRNDHTGEWKQVGGSCLKEFTQGLDAEVLAAYISCFDHLIQGEFYSYSESTPKYFSTKYILQIAHEVVRAFGYVGTNYNEATYQKVLQVYDYLQGYMKSDKLIEETEEMIQKAHIDPESEDAVKFADESRKWLMDQDTSFGYMMNLRAVVDTEYVKVKHLGLLVSLVPTYNRAMEDIRRKKAREAALASEAENSSYLGAKGERFTAKVVECKCITYWESAFGTTYMYKFVTDKGNVLIWKTSNFVDVNDVAEISGKVKDHEEYNGVKQTVVYFCKVKEKGSCEPSPEELKKLQEENRKAMQEMMESLDLMEDMMEAV